VDVADISQANGMGGMPEMVDVGGRHFVLSYECLIKY